MYIYSARSSSRSELQYAHLAVTGTQPLLGSSHLRLQCPCWVVQHPQAWLHLDTPWVHPLPLVKYGFTKFAYTFGNRAFVRQSAMFLTDGTKVNESSHSRLQCPCRVVQHPQAWLHLDKQHHLPANAKDILINYATQQALRDNRLVGSFKFGNFSIILTYEVVAQQAQHVDLLMPNYQFGLMLSDDSSGTLVYLVDDNIQTVHDVERIWNDWNGDSSTSIPMPKNLVSAFRQSKDATRLVHDYGNVLLPEKQMKEVKIDGPIPVGSLLMLPGSIIHAGPESFGVRGVMFFSGCPVQITDVAEYHPDTQYTGIFLCGQLLTLLWRLPGMGVKEREYLLRMLLKYMRQSPVKREWAHHFPLGGFSKFVETVESESLSLNDLEALIKTTAKNDTLWFL